MGPLHRFFRAACVALALLTTPAFASHYDVDYLVRFDPARASARVTVSIAPGAAATATHLDFAMPDERYSVRSADGEIVRRGERLTWHVPARGGRLVYDHRIGTRRDNGAFDARITSDWVVVRGDDLVPPARVRSTVGAQARARLRFELPPAWSDVATPYPLRDGAWIVDEPRRRFDRPVGWLIAGAIDLHRTRIGETVVELAAPRGQDTARDEAVAMLERTLHEARNAFAEVPRKMLIVRAGDPMWRGGLSGPRSFWLHTDRPLVEPDGTSPLLHELTHTTTRLRAEPGSDWIVEGIAEYYSLELRRRSGTLGGREFARIIAGLERRARAVKTLRTNRSHGPRTAAAVLLLHRLDQEIRARSNGAHDIDDVTRALAARGKVSTADLDAIVARLLGAPAQSLATPLLANVARGAEHAAAAP